jgi:glutamate N-acetyltransferase / amino-acid N-acetyltransferase
MAKVTVVSPLAPTALTVLPAIAGVKLAAAEAGIRYKGRRDVMLALLDPGTVIAGTFTRSKSPSAPVDWCRDNLKAGKARAIIVNAGNANAFTGKAGVATVKAVAAGAAKAIGAKPSEIFLASTGVIGEPLDPAPILKALPGLLAHAQAENFADAAAAIMTTDTFAKSVSVKAKLGGKIVTINGIAKGSGMIAPDMATMLVFLFTDATLPAGILQKLITRATDQSFNCITVDGDTSTSDTVLMAATCKVKGVSGLRSADDPRLKDFTRALNAATQELAHLVVKDGEGAEKFIAIEVAGAESDEAARRIGLVIGNSPLVKTAIAGEDANWGRIVMAVGKSGEKALRDKLKIWIGGVLVAARGMRDPAYKEADITPHMKGRDISIKVDLGVGRGRATVWTCDLTHRYIDINGSYRS